MKTKNNFKDEDLDLLASKFKVLSEPSRLKILSILTTGEKSVNEITDAVNLSQSNISKQLKVLLNNNIIDFTPRGLHRYYFVVDNEIIQLCNFMCKIKNKG